MLLVRFLVLAKEEVNLTIIQSMACFPFKLHPVLPKQLFTKKVRPSQVSLFTRYIVTLKYCLLL